MLAIVVEVSDACIRLVISGFTARNERDIMAQMGIIKKEGWAKGLIVRRYVELSYMGLDQKGVTICTIMNENHQMTGGIVAVRDNEVTWGK